MTAQLSREHVEEFINSIESDSVLKETRDFELKLAKRVLAGMDSEPVGCDACGGNGSVDIDHGEMGIEHMECPKCYAAPPAPVAVPDDFEEWAKNEGLIQESHGMRFVNSATDVARKAWGAAMLKAGPVTAVTVPDGWKLVPLIAFPSQWAAGQKAFNSAGINKVDAVYKAMVEAAPTAPEQEV